MGRGGTPGIRPHPLTRFQVPLCPLDVRWFLVKGIVRCHPLVRENAPHNMSMRMRVVTSVLMFEAYLYFEGPN